MFIKNKRVFLILFILLTVTTVSLLLYKKLKSNQKFYIYNSYITILAKKYNIPPSLIKAIIIVESKLNPNNVGRKGEIGLMQIRKSTAVKDWENRTIKYRKLSKGVLFYPEVNLEIGCWYFNKCKKHWNKYGNIDIITVLSLAEYNAGYSNVKRWTKGLKISSINDAIRIIKFNSTKKYIKKILKIASTLKIPHS